MNLIYENKEIQLITSSCILNDNICRKLDDLKITFSDTKEEYRKWPFEKNNIIEIKDNNFSTGLMRVDSCGLSNGKYFITALPIKKIIKEKKTRAWENINFKKLLADIAKECNMNIYFYGVDFDYKYSRIDQVEVNNIKFIDYICKLEGCILKITDNKLIVISEKYINEQISVITLDPSYFIQSYLFGSTSNNIFKSCIIKYYGENYIEGKYELNNNYDDCLKLKIPVQSIEEANRFCKNILYSYNKYETTGKFVIRKNTELAAGNVITIDKIGVFSGKYVIDKISHNITGDKSTVYVRKVIDIYE